MPFNKAEYWRGFISGAAVIFLVGVDLRRYPLHSSDDFLIVSGFVIGISGLLFALRKGKN